MKKNQLSCGFLIKDTQTGYYLGCVPTGRNGYCDIPKGLKEENETEYECACRELKEETGINADSLHNVVCCGWTPYLKNKDLYIYYAECNINIDELKCTSTFECDGKNIPEVCGYRLGNKNMYSKNMQKALNNVMSSNID